MYSEMPSFLSTYDNTSYLNPSHHGPPMLDMHANKEYLTIDSISVFLSCFHFNI